MLIIWLPYQLESGLGAVFPFSIVIRGIELCFLVTVFDKCAGESPCPQQASPLAQRPSWAFLHPQEGELWSLSFYSSACAVSGKSIPLQSLHFM